MNHVLVQLPADPQATATTAAPSATDPFANAVTTSKAVGVSLLIVIVIGIGIMLAASWRRDREKGALFVISAVAGVGLAVMFIANPEGLINALSSIGHRIVR